MKIAYIYDDAIGLHSYGKNHPMNPFRISLVHSLVKSYKLDSKMDLYSPQLVPVTYHPSEYIEQLGTVHTVDCPSFENIKEFSVRYASASVNAAQLINSGAHDIVINWAGGLHHAHKSEASGFCFTNDIVMAIQELLRANERVMYIDIDVHHGDGVEEAFYDNDRVLTLSLHKFGDGFFPETGSLIISDAKAINVPLRSGIDDASYQYIYRPIVRAAIEKFRPNVIVYQSGADSLGEDRLGVFNLSIQGHAQCLEFVKHFGIPMLILGGGGYTIHNVSRCWAYETATVCGAEIPEIVPEDNQFLHLFGPDYSSTPRFFEKHSNQNKKKYMDAITSFVMKKIDNF